MTYIHNQAKLFSIDKRMRSAVGFCAHSKNWCVKLHTKFVAQTTHYMACFLTQFETLVCKFTRYIACKWHVAQTTRYKLCFSDTVFFYTILCVVLHTSSRQPCFFTRIKACFYTLYVEGIHTMLI